ncbi:hypothetical protein GCG54_00003172 [Colletotrichum gloeosporioides]|uniref:SnoaL-like domain-containing protein n=1 Tax=Colletotrichum gloeosporioides TaxID=474922 RepID=A0A8H4FQT3_COLGL|nr:uncharacterized protein GCG54_00003172 [Colletotrichum gloeosporioides]KAF3810992.1 hypothetical protein GCG54_00003172 [Colletotrichum gloeosporioides]
MSAVPSTLPNTPDEVEAWLLNNFVAFDSLDITEHPKIFAKNAQLQFANSPVLHGIEEIQQSFVPAFSALSYMKHVPVTFGRLSLLPSRLLKSWISRLNADKVDNKVWFTVEISYRAKGDPENQTITIPASALAHLVTDGEEAGKLARFQVFLDNRPVLERIEYVSKLNNKE